MSRLKQNQSIDSLVQSINTIAQNQCSLSEQDANVLNEASKRLQNLKQKKGKTNEQILDEVAKIIELLINFFV
jgi:dsDNA-specific endonuclease/ATPase MutS2